MTCRSLPALLTLGAALLALGVGLSGCESRAPKNTQAEDPVVPVSVPVQREVTDNADFTGRTSAFKSVDVRARVTGYLMKQNYEDGAEVKAGDILFEIDPRPYQAQFDQAESQVRLYQAQLKLAKATLNRDRAVAASAAGAVSPQQLEQDIAQVEEASARVRAYEASTEIYKLNLDFTKVRTPISGLASRSYLSEGNLINQDQTLMTTVVRLDPMNAYFDLDEPTLIRLRRAVAEGKLPEGGGVKVFMGLSGEAGYPHDGEINFVNNQVNSTTGSISIRGQFSNPILKKDDPKQRRLLFPGMFVRIRMPIGLPYQALLVADQAIGSDQGLKYVYVVDAQNKAQSRRVRTGALQPDGLRVIVGPPRFKITDPVLATLLEKEGLSQEQTKKLLSLKGKDSFLDTAGTVLGKEVQEQYRDALQRIDKLVPFKTKEIPGKDGFRQALETALGKADLEKYWDTLVTTAIYDGLFPEDRIVVSGLQQVRPQTKVVPDPQPMPTQDTILRSSPTPAPSPGPGTPKTPVKMESPKSGIPGKGARK